MQVWNVLHASRWKYRTQKNRQKFAICAPSSALSDCIFTAFAAKACIDKRKKLVKQQCLPHMSSQYGELQPTNGWDRFVSLGHPSKFQQVSRLGVITAPTLLTGGQPNFARYLGRLMGSTLYIHFGGSCPWWNVARCKIHLASKSCVLLYWQCYCTALQQPASAKLRRGTRNGITVLS